ncbi:GGDEF domain-containing protein [Marinomonas sp. 15G1-11]|uniref:diguanylate cyclase n=1 Tax=Marinomonas phaeophyticola TaxID=3004091 RepID=A0ABT4JVV1_9GAMM|nr:GGDEF domain-containing protein [Marinomonas sp. 15G1-11]MCZ2722443.1 GGDEF domain-containing protein [Marinomonas sp. 15G1-11]
MMSVVMLLLALIYPKNGSTRFWAIGNSFIAAGLLLLGLRNHIPDFLSIPVSNTFITIGYCYILAGISVFVGRKIPTRSLTLVCLTLFLSFLFFTDFMPNLTARIIIISLTVSALGFASAWLFFMDKREDYRFLENILAWIFILHSCYLILRATFTYSDTPLSNFMDANTLHALSFLDVFIFSILITFGLSFLLNTELQAKLRHISETDNLTGILNRGAFLALIRSKADTHQYPISVMMIDIDHFKKINDTYGHQMGDTALAFTTDFIQTQLDETSLFGRLGGEEFCIALPNTTLAEAERLAQDLLASLSSTPLIKDGHAINISISIGITEHSETMLNIEDSLQLADKALYKAKEAGRNRLITHAA